MVYLQRWRGWWHVKLLPSRRVLCTPYNHGPCHFMQSHIRKVHPFFFFCFALIRHTRLADVTQLTATSLVGHSHYRAHCDLSGWTQSLQSSLRPLWLDTVVTELTATSLVGHSRYRAHCDLSSVARTSC